MDLALDPRREGGGRPGGRAQRWRARDSKQGSKASCLVGRLLESRGELGTEAGVCAHKLMCAHKLKHLCEREPWSLWCARPLQQAADGRNYLRELRWGVSRDELRVRRAGGMPLTRMRSGEVTEGAVYRA